MLYDIWRTSISKEGAHQPENVLPSQSLLPKQSPQPFWPELCSQKYTSIYNPNQPWSLVYYNRERRCGNKVWITFQQLYTYSNVTFHSRSSADSCTKRGMRLYVIIQDVRALLFISLQWTVFLVETHTTQKVLIQTRESICRKVCIYCIDVGTGGHRGLVWLLKVTKYVISPFLTDCINCAIHESAFPDKLKEAAISSILKKDEATIKENYRPSSVLPSTSKIYERLLKDEMIKFFDNKFSNLLSAFREGYSTQHSLIRVIEK